LIDKKESNLILFFYTLFSYLIKRLYQLILRFEHFKDAIVDLLLWKRGILHRPFVHACLIAIVVVTTVLGGVFTGSGIVAGSYPGVEQTIIASSSLTADQTTVETSQEVVTVISDKPRDQILEYEVLGGDTIGAISEKFQVSVDTIRYANNLSDVDDIYPGDKIKILPVSGVAHTVASGDTIFTVAKKYQAEPQAILDFPFNDVGDDFALAIGQILIVPDGAPPSKPKAAPTQYLAKENVNQTPVTGGGAFSWPTVGSISQYFAWYHPGVDIQNPAAPAVTASDGGRVVVAGWPDNWGYGNRIIIDHGNGFTTLYAHLSRIYVGVGQYVDKGEVIGQMGSTGRSTGTHLHIEIRRNGAALNPLSLF